ncbi:MAG: glycosyltransferase family 39 protein [Deltaproteobacteria bacterium]|nr:glycosyltransferase family 39 protein [Deltaproteobacteria bacterium]
MQIRWQLVALAVLFVLAAWQFFYRLGDVPLLDDPSEGQYSEVAREMSESGDWLTPRLNYVPFLNKPPLSYWAIAATYELLGVSELSARIPSAVAGLLIVGFTVWLGTLVFDLQAGLLSGFILASMAGFFVETHEVRPDLPLTAAICGALVAVAKLFGSSTGKVSSPRRPSPDALPILALQAALALGLLSKGMLALLLPAVVAGVLLLSERRWDLVRVFLHPRALWLFGLLVGPWHMLMSFKHSGFLWDYVINQHLLFFLDRKFPRDSTPLPLGLFWSAFALRLFPWTLFVPLSFAVAATRLRRDANQLGYRLAVSWVVFVLVFFSAASSRMEHYVIPALPAVTLLLGKMFSDYSRDRGAAWSVWLTVLLTGFAVMALAGPMLVAPLIRDQQWLQPNTDFVALARLVFSILAAGAVLAAMAALAGRRIWVVPAYVVAFAAIVPSFLRGLMLLAPVNSSAGLAVVLRRAAASGARIVYEAPTEYQYGAGLIFYLQRRVDMLAPAGFIAPTYLQPYVDTLFIDRAELQRLWENDEVLFVTDPLAQRDRPDDGVPSPHDEVGHDYARWVFSNLTEGAARPR